VRTAAVPFGIETLYQLGIFLPDQAQAFQGEKFVGVLDVF